jgi:hypothetical protein
VCGPRGKGKPATSGPRQLRSCTSTVWHECAGLDTCMNVQGWTRATYRSSRQTTRTQPFELKSSKACAAELKACADECVAFQVAVSELPRSLRLFSAVQVMLHASGTLCPPCPHNASVRQAVRPISLLAAASANEPTSRDERVLLHESQPSPSKSHSPASTSIAPSHRPVPSDPERRRE